MTLARQLLAISSIRLARCAPKLSNTKTSPSHKTGRTKFSQKALKTSVSTAPSTNIVAATPASPIKLTTEVDCPRVFRNTFLHSLTRRGASEQSGQNSGHSRFVNKFQPLVNRSFHPSPEPRSFSLIALSGDERFFLRGRRNNCSSRLSVARLTETFCLACKHSCNSARVASGCFLMCRARQLRCAADKIFFAPARPGNLSKEPLWRFCRSIFFRNVCPTLN